MDTVQSHMLGIRGTETVTETDVRTEAAVREERRCPLLPVKVERIEEVGRSYELDKARMLILP